MKQTKKTTKTAKNQAKEKKEFAEKLKDKLIKDGISADFIKNKVLFLL